MASMKPTPAMMPNTCPYNDTRVNVCSPSNRVIEILKKKRKEMGRRRRI